MPNDFENTLITATIIIIFIILLLVVFFPEQSFIFLENILSRSK